MYILSQFLRLCGGLGWGRQRGGRQEADIAVQGRASGGLNTVVAVGSEGSGFGICFGGRIDKSWQWIGVGGEGREDPRMPPSFLA